MNCDNKYNIKEAEDMWSEFDEKLKELFEFTNGKKIVIWGYKRSGWFLEHIFKREYKQIEYIIDDGTGIMPKVNIYRSFIVRNMDRDTHAVLLTFRYDQKVTDFLAECGYEEGKHYIYVKEIFFKNEMQRQLSYYNWLEYQYDLDISAPRMNADIQLAHSDCLHYSTGIDYALMDVLDNFAFSKNDAVFDFGCGKGGALLLFNRSGVEKIGGAEFDTGLYNIAVSNFHKLNLCSSGLLNQDAGLLTEELDEYNYFFMYNPFQGKTFQDVIYNIEKSYDRNKRRITLIYSGSYCHNMVLENQLFKLSKEIYTDYSVRYVYIYTISV